MIENYNEEITSVDTTFDESRKPEINQEEIDALLKKKQLKQASTKRLFLFVRIIFLTAIFLLLIGGSILLFVKQSHLQTQIERLNSGLNQSTAIQNLGLLKLQTQMDVLNKTLNGMATELVNPYMLIFGLNDIIGVLNPEEDKLIECKLKLPIEVEHHGAAIVNNELYIFGGSSVSFSVFYQVTNKCFKLDKSHKWIEVASMKENRTEITKCSIVFNSEIWVFGGMTNTGSVKTVEKYNPETNTWTYMREMIEGRPWCAASIIDGKIYVSGGGEKSIEVYDPVKNEWEIFSNNMPHEGNWHSAVVDESNLLIIGGYQNETDLDEVWKINVEDPKKEWKKMPNLNQGRSQSGAAKFKNKIIVIGEKPGIEVFDGNKWTIRSSRNLGSIGPMVLLTKQSEVDLLKNVCF